MIDHFELLSKDRIEPVSSWGMNYESLAYVHRPTTADGAARVLAAAGENGVTVAARGAGCSYGDASMNGERVVLDTSRMNRILAWNPASGRIEVEPGVTVRQLWHYCIEDGWWPPVVPGTMFVTMGGGAAMNYHGKNNYRVGPIGDHIAEFDLLLPSGLTKTCRRDTEPELFHAAIGGFGMLGIFTRLVLQMKRIFSGLLHVDALSAGSFADMIGEFEQRRQCADYLVGWIDCFAGGDAIGRGVIHQANYLRPGEDRRAAQSLRIVNQELPETLFGAVPKSLISRFMRPLTTNTGVRAINAAKYLQGRTIGDGQSVLQPHAQFAFLLDYVPNWKFAYKPGALIQFQSFVPEESAETVFRRQIIASQKAGIVPYLGVFKRHRPDAFLMTHSVDGYSLALDYPFHAGNADGVRVLAERMADIAVEHGGRFYFAKDSLLPPRIARRFLGDDRIARFAAIKNACDPDGILETQLSRRLFPDLTSAAKRPRSAPLRKASATAI